MAAEITDRTWRRELYLACRELLRQRRTRAIPRRRAKGRWGR